MHFLKLVDEKGRTHWVNLALLIRAYWYTGANRAKEPVERFCLEFGDQPSDDSALVLEDPEQIAIVTDRLELLSRLAVIDCQICEGSGIDQLDNHNIVCRGCNGTRKAVR